MKKLYKDCQLDYEQNLELYLTTGDKKYYDNIFIDFKTYCFNKIKQMRGFLPIPVIDDWALEITCNAFSAISRKGMEKKSNWPENMGAYLGMFCLAINDKKKFSPEYYESSIDVEDYIKENKNEVEGDVYLMLENDDGNIEHTLDESTGKWLIKEAIKMTVYNDGYNMLDLDRAIKLYTKYDGKIGKFSEKNKQIMEAFKKNILSILEGNIKQVEEK